MKAFPFLSVLLASLVAHAEPVVFEKDGVSFRYDSAQFGKPALKHVKAVPLANPDEKPDGVAPEHITITFPPDRGTIYVFSTADAKVKDFKTAYPTHDDAQRALKSVLAKKPAHPKNLPDLPWRDIGRDVTGKVAYIKFTGGSGVMSLGHFYVDEGPITNEGLEYIFQGITDDGAHYVAAHFVVQHPKIPNPDPKVAKPIAPKAAEIEKFAEDSFKPSLAAMRAIIQSLEVKGTH